MRLLMKINYREQERAVDMMIKSFETGRKFERQMVQLMKQAGKTRIAIDKLRKKFE